MVCMCRATPCRSRNHQEGSEQEEMSLAPYSSGCDKQPSSDTNSNQMVGCEQRSILKRPLEDEGDCHRVCGQQWGGGRGEARYETKDSKDEVALPKRPILGSLVLRSQRAERDQTH